MKTYGHEDVRIIDDGRQKWVDEGRKPSTEAPKKTRASYTARGRDESIRAYRDQVSRWLEEEEGRAVVDVRSPAEYSGGLIAPPGYEQEGAQRRRRADRAVVAA